MTISWLLMLLSCCFQLKEATPVCYSSCILMIPPSNPKWTLELRHHLVDAHIAITTKPSSCKRNFAILCPTDSKRTGVSRLTTKSPHGTDNNRKHPNTWERRMINTSTNQNSVASKHASEHPSEKQHCFSIPLQSNFCPGQH